ncbi:MAG: sulfate ABC transporter ATP-binding protein, partial [Verrucomicrobiota bacterium]
MSIQVNNIHKSFGKFKALDQINLEIPSGGLVALLGPSGSGKTTLLRIIAGLEFPDQGSGKISFNGNDVTSLPAAKRKVGFVFQHYALFNHMTVFENIAFGLRVRPKSLQPSEEEITERVLKLLKLIKLDGFEKRFPKQLSGGQRQRIALARALAVEPEVLLLDEPFGALDARVRRELRRWLRQLHEEIHVTTILVTHDQEEALEIADEVAILNHGQIEQRGHSQEVYDSPANAFVCEFLGDVNSFAGQNKSTLVRPHEIELYAQDHEGIAGVVHTVHAFGAIERLEVDLIEEKKTILVERSSMVKEKHPLKIGD